MGAVLVLPSNSKDLGKRSTGEGHKGQLLTSLYQEGCSTNHLTDGSKVIKVMVIKPTVSLPLLLL